MGAEDNHFDIIIIGGGSAGYAAARTALEYNKKVAVVDGADELGGLCILKGCMPSKTLLFTAEIVHSAQKGKKLGISCDRVNVDPHSLQMRKQQLISEFAAYRAGQLEDGRFSLYRGNARFLDHLTIKLSDSTELWADKYVIATGSSISTPPIPGLSTIGYWTSDDVLSAEKLPHSMIVLGGGVVACEMAQYLNRAGVRVTMIQRSPYLLKSYSPEAALSLQKALEAEGIEVVTATKIESIRRLEDSIVVQYQHNGFSRFAYGSDILNALGRFPNTSFLELENADIQVTPSGHIQTNMFQQTTNPAVYAAGDCSGPEEIVHIAIMQGENAAHHALGKSRVPEIDYDSIVRIVFSDPQVAVVGMNRLELESCSIDFVEASYPFNDHGKSMIMDAQYGFVKVYARKSDGVIIGAECVGKDAGELIHTLAVAVTSKLKVSDLLKVHWYHPTLSEIWTYPLEDIQEELS